MVRFSDKCSELQHLAGMKGRHDAGDDAHLAFAVFAKLVYRMKQIQGGAMLHVKAS